MADEHRARHLQRHEHSDGLLGRHAWLQRRPYRERQEEQILPKVNVEAVLTKAQLSHQTEHNLTKLSTI